MHKTLGTNNPVDAAFTYNPVDRLTGATYKNCAAVLAQYGYTYDRADNRTTHFFMTPAIVLKLDGHAAKSCLSAPTTQRPLQSFDGVFSWQNFAWLSNRPFAHSLSTECHAIDKL